VRVCRLSPPGTLKAADHDAVTPRKTDAKTAALTGRDSAADGRWPVALRRRALVGSCTASVVELPR